MSLYNMLFGRNPASTLILAMLDLTEQDVGRFRDCHLKRMEDKSLRIVIFTRNGGGNRQDYEDVTDELRSFPTFITDYDDDFDCTYASYEFGVPEQFKATAEELANLGHEAKESPMERFKKLIDDLHTKDKNDPAVARALEVGKGIFAKLEEAHKTGSNKVEV